MRLLFTLLFLGATLLACGCNHKQHAPSNMLETLKYALIMMDLQDNSDIRTAITLYKRDMKAVDKGFNADAFKGGKFDPKVYRDTHAATKKIDAQIELFDTLYLILNEAQKKRLHQLMAGHLHYLNILAKESPKSCGSGMHQNCKTNKGCGNTNKSCASKACDTK